MRKFLSVLVLVAVGVVVVVSEASALFALPGFLGSFSDGIAWLNASLSYQQEVALGAILLGASSWAFDAELDRKGGPRKRVIGTSFLVVVGGFALLLASFDHLDIDSWQGEAIADNRALEAPDKKDAASREKAGGGRATTTSADQSDGALASAGNEEWTADPAAYSSKDESGYPAGCTCSPVEKYTPPAEETYGGGGGANVEEDWAAEEAAEEVAEAAEEAQEEREEAAEEAEFEAEMGF